MYFAQMQPEGTLNVGGINTEVLQHFHTKRLTTAWSQTVF